ncbi:MAG TPA: protein arginine kinase [Tissierellaceae bacterium]
MVKWLDGTGLDEDVVVSTRLRLARNLANYRFPNFMNNDEAEAVTNEILNCMKDNVYEVPYKFYRIRDLSDTERSAFVEDHLISPNLANNLNTGSFLLRNDEKATVMINEEDHIRIQVLLPGLNFEKGWEMASSIDDSLEGKVEYAYHEKFGYLTACPTNVGTGLRASVMVHLPCITMTGHINSIIEELTKIGLTVRGIYGEGTKALGNIFQISNQTTLGESEEEIIKKLNRVVREIISRERSTRVYMLDKRNHQMEDMIYRSYGILKYGRIISSQEAMNHLSNVKLGCDLGVIDYIKSKDIVKLMIEIQPANIQRAANRDLTYEERDIYRAELIRKKLSNLEG